MKKFMIAILFLIPLLIVMTVNVSGMIISATVNISVESIILKSRGEFISNIEINFNEYNDENKYYKIDTVCYPKLAEVNLIWTTSDLNIAYVDSGKVYFVGYGEVTITASSRDNINVNSRCNFYVTGDTIYSIDIIEYGEEEAEDSIDVAIYGRKLLDKIIVPANALKDKIITWESSNENVVSIDNIGVITGNSIGTATVTISAIEEGVKIENEIEINVLPSYTYLKKDLVYISANAVDISEFTINNNFTMSVLSGQAAADGSILTYLGEGSGEVMIELNSSGITDQLKVIFTDGNYLLGYKNLDYLQETIWNKGNFIWEGSASVVLESIVLNDDYDGELPVISWLSSDTDIISTENGRLYALSGGISTITVSAEGFISGNILMSVKSPMESVSLALDKADDIKGIEGTRVFGILSYHYDENETGYIDNTFQLEVNSFRPANAEQVYDYRSSNSNFASIDENGLITFYPAGIDKSVIIYITARYSVSAIPVRDYYEFHLVDGVNIGLNVSSSENTDDAPVFRLFNEIKEVSGNAGNQNSSVLHSNIYVPISSQGGGSINIYGNIYGNGYKYDAQYLEKTFATSAFNIDFSFSSNLLTIKNLTINSAIPTDDFMVYIDNGGTLFCLTGSDQTVGEKRLIFKFCTVQYSYCHYYISGGRVTFDGCVFRNTAGPTMNIDNDFGNHPDVTIKNCVFSNIIAPIVTLYNRFSTDNLDTPMDSYASLTLEGNNYIYNWKEIQNIEVDIVPEAAMPEGLAEIFNDKINKTVRTEIKQSKFDVIKVDAKDPITGFNKTYVNFSILIIGVWRDATQFNLNYDYDKYVNIEVDIKNTEIGSILGANFSKSCFLLTPKNSDGTPTTLPNETYELNEITLKRLKGE